MIASPACTATVETLPARGASTLFSIFIASKTSNVCPSATVSPGLTNTFITVPGRGEHTVPAPAPEADRGARMAAGSVSVALGV